MQGARERVRRRDTIRAPDGYALEAVGALGIEGGGVARCRESGGSEEQLNIFLSQLRRRHGMCVRGQTSGHSECSWAFPSHQERDGGALVREAALQRSRGFGCPGGGEKAAALFGGWAITLCPLLADTTDRGCCDARGPLAGHTQDCDAGCERPCATLCRPVHHG